jgi:hypothetical protein
MKDEEIKLTDVPGIEVQESENNLILTFKEKMVYEPGDTITIWCSELIEREIDKRRFPKWECKCGSLNWWTDKQCPMCLESRELGIK